MNSIVIRNIAVAACAGGFVFLFSAIFWWWAVYGPIWQTSAGVRTEILGCALSVDSVCVFLADYCSAQHLFGIDTYNSSLAWFGVSLIVSSVIIDIWKQIARPA
ncbi:hypothetical protein [Ensifer sp. Root31]|uniref:hypothetical protein n=1 Tax=Ensifer sp. Root31 TaxID=1736512 RepID=UPI0012E7AE7A|nr:hypothetical protein [Ensifer sp. Root31]